MASRVKMGTFCPPITAVATADGTPPTDGWITYRDLPDGMFYAQAFRGYAEARLVRELGEEGIDAFRRGAEAIGGEPSATPVPWVIRFTRRWRTPWICSTSPRRMFLGSR